MNPGDTSTDSTFARRFTSLNEGRGVNPGDTGSHGVVPHEYAVLALNEGRGVNPGDTSAARRRPSPSSALNEGRGVNPGDTANAANHPAACHFRSTKAGA